MRHTSTFLLVALFTTLVASHIGAVPLDPIQRGTIAVNLQPVATGLGAPLYGISPPGDNTRMYVLDQNGIIRVYHNQTGTITDFMNIQSRVSPPLNTASANDERGLLGITFHPNFGASDPSTPGYRTFYTYNSEATGTGPTFPVPAGGTLNYKNVVNEWKMQGSSLDTVDLNSRREVVSFGKSAQNHNGGTIVYGPDGYMYLALGDGGNANDTGNGHIVSTGNAQDLSVPFGKMLRFNPLLPNPADVSNPDPISSNGQYRTPADNPFTGANQLKEIYAYGFRNPYRFSFNPNNNDLIVADVGQNTIEEIDRVTKGGNYGWVMKEGDFTFNRTTGAVIARSPGSPAGLIDPISGPAGTLEYDHGDGISITGGFVYHGTAIPELIGKYVFGDLALHGSPVRADGRLFYADLATGELKEFLLPAFAGNVLPNGLTVHGFGQDGNGELYAMVTNTPSNGTGGQILELVPFVPEPGSIGLIMLAAALVTYRRHGFSS